MRTVEARKVCKRLHAYLRLASERTRVHSVFPHTLNIVSSFGLFTFLQGNTDLRPFSCILDTMPSFDELKCKVGDEVLLTGERIELPQSDFAVGYQNVQAVDLSVEAMLHLYLPLDFAFRLRFVKKILQERSQTEDLTALALDGMPDNPYTALLRPKLTQLRLSLVESSIEDAAATAGAMSGCGMGLTPASDDFLCGYMSAYAVLSKVIDRKRERVLYLTRAMSAEAAKHTNEISSAFLLQSGEGLMVESVFELLLALFSDAPYTAITVNANRVVKLGATSGLDMLTGLYLGIRHNLGGIEYD